VKRYCDGCRCYHDLDAFDLEGGESSAVCRDHAQKRELTAEAGDRRERQAKITALERQRRSLIASLVKIDAEIAALRSVSRSSPFKRVDPADVFDGSDDLGFGD
jgi:hypothetical protein